MRKYDVKFPDGPLPNVKPLLKYEGKHPLYRLEEDYPVQVGDCVFKVPKGFRYDGRSTPWGAWNTFSPWDPSTAGAVIWHDWTCAAELWPYRVCDQMFYWGLRRLGESRARARFQYTAVRLGGWTKHRHHTNKSVMILRNLGGIVGTKRPLWR